MIGLALVTLVSILAASIVHDVHRRRDDLWDADYAITAQNNFSPLLIDAAGLPRRPRVSIAVGNVRAGETLAFGSPSSSTRCRPSSGRMINSIGSGLGRRARRARRGRRLRRQTTSPRTTTCRSARRWRRRSPNGKTGRSWSRGSSTRRLVARPSACHDLDRSWDPQNPNPQNLYSFVIMNGGETDANPAALDAALEEFPNAKFADARGVRRQPDLRAPAGP